MQEVLEEAEIIEGSKAHKGSYGSRPLGLNVNQELNYNDYSKL